MQSIDQVYPLLGQPQKITITTHQKPDGDAMGSSLGLLHFLVAQGHQVRVISPTNWADFLDWMPGIEWVFNFEQQKDKALQWLDQSDWLFCLDFNVFHRTKHLAPYLAKAKARKVLVDHHEQPDVASFDFGISLTSKSSTCEMIYDFIQSSPQPTLLNQDMAVCLYAGVMTDTGSFRFASTGAAVHRMVAHLKETGFNHTDVHSHIYDNFLESRLRFIGFVLSNRMEVLYEYNTALMYISQKDLQDYQIKTGDTEGLVNYLLTIKGIRMGAICVDRTEERKWSFRSKGHFDVNTFARVHFEGGGHFHAAGGRSSKSLEQTILDFKAILPAYQQQLQ